MSPFGARSSYVVARTINVEVAMREKGVVWISRELARDWQTKTKTSDATDVDQPGAVPKTATIAPGSTVQSECTVELESMVFSQGGHLMSKKKVQASKKAHSRAARRVIKRCTSPLRSRNLSLPVSSSPSTASLLGRVRFSGRASGTSIASRASFTPSLLAPTNQSFYVHPLLLARYGRVLLSSCAIADLPCRPMSLC
jgi:hypothetical protein